uniref:FliM/FliN family flagellar motor switch protein n=1 Tax=Frigidibacter oleivorans TaxID=2487129 RepID=UPI00197ACD62
PADAPDIGAALAARVLTADARIDAVLARLSLPLARLLALAPGATLTLPGAALAALRLEGPGGVAVARAELGQAEGRRAIRLTAAAPGQDCPGGGEAVPAPDVAAAEEGAGWPEAGLPVRMAG